MHVSPPYHVTGPSSGSPLLIRVEPSVKPKSKGTPETEAKRPADDDKMKREEASCDEVSSSNDVISVETVRTVLSIHSDFPPSIRSKTIF